MLFPMNWEHISGQSHESHPKSLSIFCRTSAGWQRNSKTTAYESNGPVNKAGDTDVDAPFPQAPATEALMTSSYDDIYTEMKPNVERYLKLRGKLSVTVSSIDKVFAPYMNCFVFLISSCAHGRPHSHCRRSRWRHTHCHNWCSAMLPSSRLSPAVVRAPTLLEHHKASSWSKFETKSTNAPGAVPGRHYKSWHLVAGWVLAANRAPLSGSFSPLADIGTLNNANNSGLPKKGPVRSRTNRMAPKL
jgi:hypothetical protein